MLVEKRLGQMSAVSMPFASENHQTMLTNKSGFNKKEIGVKNKCDKYHVEHQMGGKIYESLLFPN